MRSGRGRVMAMVAVVGLLAACGDDAGSTDTAAPTAAATTTVGAPITTTAADAIDGTAWVLDTAPLGIEGAGEVVATLEFVKDRVSGGAGCNRFFGPYVVDGSSLTFGEIAQTAMACPGPRMDVESAYVPVLAKVTSYVIDGDALLLRDAHGTTLLAFTRDDRSVVGPWTVTGFVTVDSGFVAPLEGTTLTVTFVASGIVSGDSGCNTFGGTATVDGRRLVIGPLASTKKACAEPGEMDQELDFLAALQSATQFVPTPDGVTLANDRGGAVVTLRAA